MDDFSLLQSLILEFYESNISNQRRKEIEDILRSHENQKDSWKNCILYIQESQNIFIRSFCLKVIENAVSKHWSRLSLEDKTTLRTSLQNCLFNSKNSFPSVFAKKLMKLIAIIARNEWPVMCSTFVNDILNIILMNDSNMVLLGLSSLLIAAEELINPQENVCMARKFEIKKYIETCLPYIFLVLNNTFQKYKNSATEDSIYEGILNLYSQLFSWVPLSDLYTVDLLLPVFECLNHNNLKIKILSLTVLNEILYKNCVPSKCIPVVVTIFFKLNEMLQHFTGMKIITVENERILMKILEMINLIFSLHWHRIEMNVETTIITSFLSFFYTLSFHHVHAEYYDNCLDIWSNFLEYLTMRETIHVKHYESLLVSVLQEILYKLRAKTAIHNSDSADKFDMIFNQHMNLIDLLTELLSDNAFKLMFDMWISSKITYIQLLTGEKSTNTLFTEVEIIESLRTFEVSTHILTSLHSKIDSNLNISIVQDLWDIIYLANKKYPSYCAYTMQYSHDLLRVHYQLMKVIPTWICLTSEKDDYKITNLFLTTLPFITESHLTVHPELQIAAAYLIAHLANCLKDANLLQPLLTDLTFKNLPSEAQRLLQCALFNFVCNCKNESYETKLKFLHDLFGVVTSQQIENLENITMILHDSKINHSEGRDVLFIALEPWLTYIIEEYPKNFAKNFKLCEIFIAFLLEAFRIFQDHANFTTIQKMLFMFDKCLSNCNNFSDKNLGIDKIIMLLTILVENPGHIYKEYISDIIAIVEKIFQLIRKEPHLTFVAEFYKLLCRILLTKWSYFHKNAESNDSKLNRQTEFEILLTYILESFKQSDISTFRTTMSCLEEMNMKWNLYNKELFRLKYLPTLLSHFLNILIENTHKLLTDDILTFVYHMVAIDFEAFFSMYIPLFLMQISGLTQNQINTLKHNINPQKDMPSFVIIINTLINDIRFYRAENGYI